MGISRVSDLHLWRDCRTGPCSGGKRLYDCKADYELWERTGGSACRLSTTTLHVPERWLLERRAYTGPLTVKLIITLSALTARHGL